MKYDHKFYENYMEKLKELNGVDWVASNIKLKKKLEEKPNFWTIIQYGKGEKEEQDNNLFNTKSSHETRSAKMFNWLLDPNENHNLGNIFAYEIIRKVDINAAYKKGLAKNNLIKSETEALNSQIDIFYQDLDQDVCITIELKQHSKEHATTGYDSQLDKYEDATNEFVKKQGRDILVYYIYLTPRNLPHIKDEISNENWIIVGYDDIIDILEKIDKTHLLNSDYIYKDDVRKIIGDFKDDLQNTLSEYNVDKEFIKDLFSKEELQLNNKLTKEILEGEKMDHMKIMSGLNDTNIDIETLVLLIDQNSGYQDKTPNEAVGILMRKIFNFLSDERELSLDTDIRYKDQERTDKIKRGIIDKYKLDFDTIRLSQGKGQGLYFHHSTMDNKEVYFSGDAKGKVPNHGVQLVDYTEGRSNYKIEKRSERTKQDMFYVDYDLVDNNKIAYKDGTAISIGEFLDEYILADVQEYSEYISKTNML